MAITRINYFLLNKEPDFGCRALADRPYVLGYNYISHAIYSGENSISNLTLCQRIISFILGISLLVPVVNVIIYIALKIGIIPITPIQEIKILVNEKIATAQKINNQGIQNEVMLLIGQIEDQVETLENEHNLTASIVQKLQYQLLCIEEQTQFLTEEAICWAQNIKKTFNFNEFKDLLEMGKKKHFMRLKFSCFMGGTIFHHCLKIFSTFIPQLTSAGIDPASQDMWGNTGLTWTIANADNTIAMSILNYFGKGVYLDVQAFRFRGNSALHLAVAKGYKDKDADGNKLDYSNLQLIEALLLAQANPNLQDENGNTPLHLACVRRDLPMIEILLKAGANPNIKNKSGAVAKDLINIGYESASKILKDASSVYLLDKQEYEAAYERAHCLFS